jgi:hypothetical protein
MVAELEAEAKAGEGVAGAAEGGGGVEERAVGGAEMEVAMVVDSAGELVAEAREAERGAEQEAEMVAA